MESSSLYRSTEVVNVKFLYITGLLRMDQHVYIAIRTWFTSVQMQVVDAGHVLTLVSKSSDHPVCMEIVYTLGESNKMNCLDQ